VINWKPWLIFLLLPAVQSYGEPQFLDSTLHYSFAVPGGWERYTSGELAALHRESSKVDLTLTYDAAFRRDGHVRPYLLISHQAVANQSLARVVEVLARDTLQVLDDVVTQLDTSVQFDLPRIDHARQLVSISGAGTGPDGPFKSLMVLKPGRLGVIQLNFYADASTFASDIADFETGLDSLRFAPGSEAPPSGASRIRWSEVAITGLVTALVTACVERVRRLRTPPLRDRSVRGDFRRRTDRHSGPPPTS